MRLLLALLLLESAAPAAAQAPLASMFDVSAASASAAGHGRDDFAPVGTLTDIYAAAEGRSGFVKIGELQLLEGFNVINLTMPERNPKSRGAEVAIIDIEGRLIASAD